MFGRNILLKATCLPQKMLQKENFNFIIFIVLRSEHYKTPDWKKGHPFFEKGRFRVPNSKSMTFSHHYGNKIHKHVNWGLKSIFPDQKLGHPFFEKGRFWVQILKKGDLHHHYSNKIQYIALFSMLWKIATNHPLIFGQATCFKI